MSLKKLEDTQTDGHRRIDREEGDLISLILLFQNKENTMFPHYNIYKFNCTSPHGKTHDYIYSILIDRRRNSNVLHVRSFREQTMILPTTWCWQKLGRDWL
jgi:hypothetical protein